jgi:hypothetical protein
MGPASDLRDGRRLHKLGSWLDHLLDAGISGHEGQTDAAANSRLVPVGGDVGVEDTKSPTDAAVGEPILIRPMMATYKRYPFGRGGGRWFAVPLVAVFRRPLSPCRRVAERWWACL